ncbi:glutamate dehydrogenase (NAD(P)+) [Pseudonocardia oroxyli]|uniref:Glutamate dehydrogenase n=2 Tax=Pseudonocardia oroxyli TaxID=366584 RepID=A0A1G7JE74_PSEOR|nr:glutamate dehydrogenase (NAD(P)+) [Pseudonocardia oroxyli]
MTTMQEPLGAVPTTAASTPAVSQDPMLRLTWTDRVTDARGYLVVHTLRSGIATGGTRMRPGCTLGEVEDLARGMAAKTAAFDLPVGGAKGGIDFDPKDPRAFGVLQRFMAAMRPWIEAHWVTAEDLGVPQHLVDEVFASLGMGQSYYSAIRRSTDPARTLERVRKGLNAQVPGGLLGDVIGGYGVAHACLGAARSHRWEIERTTVSIQGVGTMGGAAAWYLHEAGMKVVAVADAAGTLHDPAGLDVPALLDLRDAYGEIDRTRLPAGVVALPRAAVVGIEADVFVPAAISYAITPDNSFDVAAKVVVEAANAATTPEAEAMLAARGIPVVPDFVANAGAAAWAWWLLLGWVGMEHNDVTTAEDSFRLLRTQMAERVQVLLGRWHAEGVRPRETGLQMAVSDLDGQENTLVIP